MSEENKELSAVPASKSVTVSPREPNSPVIRYTAIVAIMPPRNAIAPIVEKPGIETVQPNTIAVTAPNAEPDDVPMIYGSANGLRKSP